jgi:hypothetical protein
VLNNPIGNREIDGRYFDGSDEGKQQELKGELIS